MRLLHIILLFSVTAWVLDEAVADVVCHIHTENMQISHSLGTKWRHDFILEERQLDLKITFASNLFRVKNQGNGKFLGFHDYRLAIATFRT